MKTKEKKVVVSKKTKKKKEKKVQSKEKTPLTKGEWLPLPNDIWDEAIKRNPKIKIG